MSNTHAGRVKPMTMANMGMAIKRNWQDSFQFCGEAAVAGHVDCEGLGTVDC